MPIIKTVIFCGKQELPLRGHGDSGKINTENDSEINDGVFRAALRFRLDAGDSVLSNHLDTMAKNSSYTSWQSQNEIIDACNTVILNEIVSSVNDATFFCILVDDN